MASKKSGKAESGKPKRPSGTRKKPSPREAGAKRKQSGSASREKKSSRKRPGEERPRSDARVPIVGIGGSAGGLEALTELLRNLPGDTGMAFVYASHLSETHKSMLSEILGRTTQMRVVEIRSRTPVRPNHVYVLPASRELSVVDGALNTKSLSGPAYPPRVIDFFLRSLAEARRNRAIGVILSGTGNDGMLGLSAIKAAGGIAFVQDEGSAKHPEMPRNAVLTPGSVDFVLPPERIAAELARLADHPYVAAEPGETAGKSLIEDPSPLGLDAVFRVVRNKTGADFTHYKRTTTGRRVWRRMLLLRIDSVERYVERLRSDPDEVRALSHDLLINVTSFFREPDAFEHLRKAVIPQILKGHESDVPVRVWVPACASGEEAFSVAICLLEAVEAAGSSPLLQVFATDISEAAITYARDGVYPENIKIDVSPERLGRFFTRVNGGYRVAKQVRDVCIFANQDVVRDPPFSNIDLISCRNMLIYMDSSLQERVLETFHYALTPAGFLVLGASESAGAAQGLFRQTDGKMQIYRKSEHPAAVRHFGRWDSTRGSDERGAAERLSVRIQRDVGAMADRVLLSRYAPAGVLVNSAMEILQFRGKTGAFLEPAPGRASLHLLRMARPGLDTELGTLFKEAKKAGAPVRLNGVAIGDGPEKRVVDLEIVPVADGREEAAHFLVIFHETAEKGRPQARRAEARATQPPSVGNRETDRLRAQLSRTQAHLQAIIEEQEITNEALQAANEEVLSANEELQSTNEELETAKEELQATNEELTTVNEELQNRNDELAKANDDLNNLISSVDVVYLNVGGDLRIRRFTPAAERLLNLIPTDVNRPISDIRPRVDVPDLGDTIAGVIESMEPVDREVRDEDGRWYRMQIRPYKTKERKIDGAILSLSDIDQSKRTAESWQRLVEKYPDFILSASPAGHVLFVNRTVASLATRGVIGDSIFDYLEPDRHPSLRPAIQEVARTGRTTKFKPPGLGPLRGTDRSIVSIEAIRSDDRTTIALVLLTQKGQ